MEFIEYFSKNIITILQKLNESKRLNNIEEIRLRTNKNIILRFFDEELILDYKVTTSDILETLEKITENSVYSYENQIIQGFITLKGGHRVGITGNAISENGKIINISYISGMNFRIARQIKGCSNFLLEHLYSKGDLKNTLLLGAPGSGKTTLLRDLIRQISNGNEFGQGLNVGVVDERNEISYMYKGSEQSDLGIRTDTLAGIPKILGIRMLIRSMAPNVIAVDEIGNRLDLENIQYAMCSGVKVLLTAHGDSILDLKLNQELSKIIDLKMIERVIVLDSRYKQRIKEVYYLNKEKEDYIKLCI